MRLHYLQNHTDGKPRLLDEFRTIKDDVVVQYPHEKVKTFYKSCVLICIATGFWLVIEAIIDSKSY